MKKIDLSSIEEALSGHTSRFFWVYSAPGVTESGDKESYYGKSISDEHLTFDISNNKVLVNMSMRGTIKFFTTYRESYPVDDIPGVWWRKDFTQTGPYSYLIRIGDTVFDLDKVDWPLKTSLLGNIFPFTKMFSDKVEVDLILYAPISCDGKFRPPAVFYGIWLKNVSGGQVEGQIILPKSRINTYIAIADSVPFSEEVPFKLARNQSLWIPTVIAAVPGEETMLEVNRLSSLEWLNETWSYFRSMTGHLEMPQDPFTAEFFERALHQCFESIGMTQQGEIAGSNWGSYPATSEIWMKDMYYSYLPFFAYEPEFFKKGILWFLERSLRFKRNKKVYDPKIGELWGGRKMEGGISHSLSNALTPVIMTGLYYSVTGDKEFFQNNPKVLSKIKNLLAAVLESRIGEPYLFPSTWISDGPSRGDYHTGSNVVAWHSFKSAAEIVEDVEGAVEQAYRYRTIAEQIKRDLERTNIVSGPLGPQYAEGVNTDGSIVFLHNGEESDTTLMAFYGYTPYDDPSYQNHCRVAMTTANPFYRPNTRGIGFWHHTDATFPGHITGLAGVRNQEEMSGPQGGMSIIRRVTDVDGSIWWWPYKVGDMEGAVVRGNPIGGGRVVGKCGWASGVFVAHFVSQILGLSYDARTNTLSFRPFSPSSDFAWEDFRLGNKFFSVEFKRGKGRTEVSIENLNETDVKSQLELVLDQSTKPQKVMLNGKTYEGRIGSGRFFDSNTLKIEFIIPKRQKCSVEVTYVID